MQDTIPTANQTPTRNRPMIWLAAAVIVFVAVVAIVLTRSDGEGGSGALTESDFLGVWQTTVVFVEFRSDGTYGVWSTPNFDLEPRERGTWSFGGGQLTWAAAADSPGCAGMTSLYTAEPAEPTGAIGLTLVGDGSCLPRDGDIARAGKITPYTP